MKQAGTRCGALLLSAVLAGACPAAAATVPSGFTELTYASGFGQPTSMAFAPDGRLFICEKTGKLRVVSAAGVLQAAPFVDLTSKISQGNERGLLGVTFDPQFSSNHYVYVFYSAKDPAPHSRVSRFTAQGDAALAGSETVIFDLDNLSANENHNGGAIHFGKDGKLYVASGDNRNPTQAQSLLTTHGKIHRINADPANLVPADNPFVGNTTPGVKKTIYALGFRNPFTFGVHPGTGRIFVNDVGEVSTEEVNDLLAGKNYGWPTCEGSCSNPSFTNPIYSYSHTQGCAITGGAFYNPPTPQFPANYVGRYFTGDLCRNWMRTIDPGNGNAVADFGADFVGPVDFAVGPDGALYVLNNRNSTVSKVQYTANLPPSIVAHPADQSVGVGQTAVFSVSAAGTPPLTFQWQKNGSNIAGATASQYTAPAATLADNNALFRCVVANGLGNAASNAAKLTVTGQPPLPVISQPIPGLLYVAGQPVGFAGSATDPEDGALPAGAFTWDVDFHHDDSGHHSHPGPAPVSGVTSGSFTPSATEEFSHNVWYRINLSVQDSAGITGTVFRDVFPQKSTMTFTTNPAGLQLGLDGQPIATPRVVRGVVGVIRAVNAPGPQTMGGKTYEFLSWSDGGAAGHNIATPAANTTYTATFREVDLTPPTPPRNLQQR